MEFSIHQQILTTVFITAVVMGAVAGKTNFCTMGAVSDWVNIGDTGRLRAWMLAIAVAMMGVAVLEYTGKLSIGNDTFPPYRTPGFAWLRYVLGGMMFGAGMTLASGCGNKTLVRIGAGNLKSLVVLAIASVCAYAMLWTDFYGVVFHRWISVATLNLGTSGMTSQALGDLTGLGNPLLGALLSLAVGVFCFASREFRHSVDNILGGVVTGLTVVIGWILSGGAMGLAWKEWADFADVRPLRVETQSLTFVSPMGDFVRYLTQPTDFSRITFGIVALFGVIAGSFLYALATRGLRLEWFANRSDFAHHALGAALMGVGGVLAMGCTVGQGITGVSTLALGSVLALLAMVSGSALTMKYQVWRVTRNA
jgi:uncharacterized membrane protein YedE/YeeE